MEVFVSGRFFDDAEPRADVAPAPAAYTRRRLHKAKRRHYIHADCLADACLQIELDDSAKQVLTTNTPRGLLRYNRLPVGVKSASDFFQQIMDSMICGRNGCADYLDDDIVAAQSRSTLPIWKSCSKDIRLWLLRPNRRVQFPHATTPIPFRHHRCNRTPTRSFYDRCHSEDVVS